MEFSRREYPSGLPFPSPGDLLDPGIEPRSPTSQVDSLLSEPPGKPASRDQNPNSKTQQASQSLSEGHRLVSLLPAEGWSLSALRSPTKHHAHGNLPPSSLNFKLTYLKFPLTFRWNHHPPLDTRVVLSSCGVLFCELDVCNPLILLVFTQLCIFFKCQSFSHVKSFPQFELHQNLYITYIKICWVFLFFFFNATMGTPSFALVQAGGVRWESRAQTCWHFPGG